jgi:hypothetical protein
MAEAREKNLKIPIQSKHGGCCKWQCKNNTKEQINVEHLKTMCCCVAKVLIK